MRLVPAANHAAPFIRNTACYGVNDLQCLTRLFLSPLDPLKLSVETHTNAVSVLSQSTASPNVPSYFSNAKEERPKTRARAARLTKKVSCPSRVLSETLSPSSGGEFKREERTVNKIMCDVSSSSQQRSLTSSFGGPD